MQKAYCAVREDLESRCDGMNVLNMSAREN